MKALTYPVCLQVSQTPALEGAQCSSQEEILIRRDNWQIFFFLCMQCIHARVSSWCSFKPTKDNKLPQQGRKSGTSWRKGAPTLCSDDLKPTIQCDKTLGAKTFERGMSSSLWCSWLSSSSSYYLHERRSPHSLLSHSSICWSVLPVSSLPCLSPR